MLGTIITTVVVYEGIQIAAAQVARRIKARPVATACRHGKAGPFMCLDCETGRH